MILKLQTTGCATNGIHIIIALAKKSWGGTCQVVWNIYKEGLAKPVDPSKDYMQKALKRIKKIITVHSLQPN
jgi:hypothetical protein